MTPDSQPTSATGRGAFFKRLLLSLFSLLLVIGLIELGLRATGYRTPELVGEEAAREMKKVAPGARFVYRGYLYGAFSDGANPVTLNSQAFHDVEHASERASTNTFRLLVLGDSYVAALSVPLQQTFFRRLEERLRREDPLHCGDYEVIAMGRGNQAQRAERAYLTQAVPVYRPDAVLTVFFCGNDIMENCEETFAAAGNFARFYQKKVAPAKALMFNRLLLFPNSRLNGLLAESLTTWYAQNLYRFEASVSRDDLISPEMGVYAESLAPVWERAYASTDRELRAMTDEARRLDVPLWIASLSGPQALGDLARGLSGGRPARWIADWCATNDIPHCDLQPAIEAAGAKEAYWKHDGHLNVIGNEAIVEPILRFVAKHGRPEAATR